MAGLLGGCEFEQRYLPAKITIDAFLNSPDSYAALAFDWDGSRSADGAASSDPTQLQGTVSAPAALPDVSDPFGHFRLVELESLAPGAWTFHVTVRDGAQQRYLFTCGQRIYDHDPSLLVVVTPGAAGATTQESTNCTCDVGCTVSGGGGPVHDLAVENVVAPAGPVANQPSTVSVEVGNHGEVTDSASVSLTDGGSPVGSAVPVTLTPGVPQTLGIAWTPSTAGPHTLVATIDATVYDSVPADNSFAATVTVQPANVCPVVSGNTPNTITATTTVTVTGTGFTVGSTVSVAGGGGSPPTVTAVTFQSPTTLDVTVRVVALTSRGTYQFVVTNDPGGPNQCVSPPGGSLTY